METYCCRKEQLLLMGFSDYREYLKSDLWFGIRKDALRRSCEICSRKSRVVHHYSYHRSVLDGIETGLLVSLCNYCHKNIELVSDEKIGLDEAQRRLISVLIFKGKRGRAAELKRLHSSLFSKSVDTRPKSAFERSVERRLRFMKGSPVS